MSRQARFYRHHGPLASYYTLRIGRRWLYWHDGRLRFSKYGDVVSGDDATYWLHAAIAGLAFALVTFAGVMDSWALLTAGLVVFAAWLGMTVRAIRKG